MDNLYALGGWGPLVSGIAGLPLRPPSESKLAVALCAAAGIALILIVVAVMVAMAWYTNHLLR